MKILCLFLLVSGAQATVGTITKLRLMDAVTNQPIAQFDPLTNNAVIDLVKLSSTSFTIEAVTNGRIGSIKFSSGTFVNIENAGRWAMCRNNGNDLFPCKSLVEGFDGTVTATPYSEDNAKGNMGTPFPITFKIIRSPCPNGAITYQPGKATVSQNGMILSAGLTSRLIAERGKQVLLSDGTYSKDVFHGLPDAAAIFEDPNSDSYKYVSNSELGNIPNSTLGIGGVGSITFDKYGNVTGFEILQNGTIRNCGGGKTWWNTWLTCEEYAGGQVYEIDPFKPPKTDRKTVLAQPYTSPWESAAYDNRDTNKPTFYVTADKSNGPLLRFTPAPSTVATAKATNDYSNLLHDNVTGTQWEYMVMKPDPTTNLTGTFTWTTNVTVSEISARNFYRSSEGLGT